MSDDGRIRHSKAQEASLVTDPVEKARREAQNALRQYERIDALVQSWLEPGRAFKLRPSAILDLHRVALDGLTGYAGNWRPGSVEIGKSKHKPPAGHLVPELIEELCDYVNDNWTAKTASHLAAYVMWRLNWIHPFSDGNGRTSRAVSYLVLSLKVGYRLPGTPTIPEQIMENREPYYEALEKADEAAARDAIDVSALEQMIESMLAKQLLSVVEKASGKKAQ